VDNAVLGDDQAPVRLTEKAIQTVKQAIADEGLEGYGLRVAVRGGGCSGLQYELDFTNEERVGDTILEVDGLKIFIDMASSTFLKGTEIDYVSTLQASGFKFNNPNAKRTCGCGSSFS
jgi:iron-sulfur cluster assembly accessory protein